MKHAPRPELLPKQMRRTVGQARLARRSIQRMEGPSGSRGREPLPAPPDHYQGPARIRQWDLACRLQNTVGVIDGSGNCIGVALAFVADMLNDAALLRSRGWSEYARILSEAGGKLKSQYKQGGKQFLKSLKIEVPGDPRSTVLMGTEHFLIWLNITTLRSNDEALILSLNDHAIAVFRYDDVYYWCDSEIGIYVCRGVNALLDVIRQQYYSLFFQGEITEFTYRSLGY